MSNDYPPSGVLFPNNKKQAPKQPDYTGHLELSDEVINDLVSQMEGGNPKPILDVAGWKRTSAKNGSTFLSLVGNVHYKRKKTLTDEEVPF